MKEKKHIIARLADTADLSDEAIPGLPLIEIAGDRRVLIEHHCGVSAYSCEHICVNVKFGAVFVKGCNLELTRITKEQLIITGRIESVGLLRRG